MTSPLNTHSSVLNITPWVRWFELALLFVGAPLAVWWLGWTEHLMVILVAVGLTCLIVLLTDVGFHRERLFRWDPAQRHGRLMLQVFFPGALLVLVVMLTLLPDEVFRWPREHTALWLSTLLLYPIVSVIPQEVIFRTFFFHRYKAILPSRWHRLCLSSVCFGMAHIVYGNWVAVAVSTLGGLVFGYRYMESRSTPTVVAEHVLWGSFLFTVGLGSFLVVEAPV